MANQLAILHGSPEGNKIMPLTQKRNNHQNKIRYVVVEIIEQLIQSCFITKSVLFILNELLKFTVTIFQTSIGVFCT